MLSQQQPDLCNEQQIHTYSGANGSFAFKGFSREHFPEVLMDRMTSSLLSSSYGHSAKLHTSHNAIPNDLQHVMVM